MASLWNRLLGLDQRVVVEGVTWGEKAQAVVASVRVKKGSRLRCGRCGEPAPGYDEGEGRRRWRALDLGTRRVLLEADSPRVDCPLHGVVVSSVPWARHGAGHTRDFDETVAWLAVQCSKTAVAQLMRVAWRTVGAIVSRVWADTEESYDRFSGLRRIGIDEISYRRGFLYLTVVVDHDSGRLVWAAPGHNKATLQAFFDALGKERCQKITHVTADQADYIREAVRANCPEAILCADPFHVVGWATDALDVVRRQAWNEARALARTEPKRPGGRPPKDAPPRPGHEKKRALKNARYALWKNPENLTPNQQEKLAWIAKTDPRLHRAYLLKEGLRTVFSLEEGETEEALDQWISWGRRCRIPAFVDLQRRIVKHRAAIDASIEHRLSNALVESTNTKIRLLTRLAFGFHSPHALIALCMLALGGHRPTLPGRIPP